MARQARASAPRGLGRHDPRELSRRQLLERLGAAALSPFVLSRLDAWERDFPVPDLDESSVLRCVVGLRPCRRGSVRIEAEELDGRTLVHDYGHGGAGITLSWGAALEAVRLLSARVAAPQTVAVLGAGISGLSCARVLLEQGHGVRIYAESFTPDTTSDVAGGQWAPALVARGEPRQFERLLRGSYARFRALIGDEWGVRVRPNYVTRRGRGPFEHVPEDLVPLERSYDRLPLEGVQRPGKLFYTMLIEPPIYLPRLFAEVRAAGAEVETRSFGSLDDVLALPERAIVNCLGLGAREVFADRALYPVRGHLVHLRPQWLPWLLSHDGYVFPRADAVVLGGTAERNVEALEPAAARCAAVLARNRRFFR